MRVRRGVEFVVLFFGAVGGYALLGSPGSPIPVLLVAGALAFLLHRYAPVFGTGWAAAAASAVAFGFAHVIFGSVWSVLLTLAGGWLFARRYQRTGSLLAACVEHSLYGVLAFTIGLGDLFYHGTY